VEEEGALETLLSERQRLLALVEQEREQLDSLRLIVDGVSERIHGAERALEEIDSVLGRAPQLRLTDADIRLRGKRLQEVAIEVLKNELGPGVELHYKEWFELLRANGHRVAGKEPLNTFLAQINRTDSVERVGRRTGRYRLAA
jgi:hypothetical protein